MTRRFYLLVMTASIVLADGATAGILFNRKPKPSSQRAQELLTTVLSDASESKRAAAAVELGDYDGKEFPEVVPGLLQAMKDSAADVRASATTSVSKIRPVSSDVGQALEQALNDSSMKVRLSARTALWGYSAAGYKPTKGDAGKPVEAPKVEAAKPAEPAIKPMFPPAAAKPLPAAPTVAKPMPAAPVAPAVPVAPRPLPPAPVVSKPMPAAPVKQEPPLADPLPTAPATSRLVPVTPPQLQAPTPSVPQRLPVSTPVAPPAEPADQGPMLNPPM